jgi:hypothetical protein
MNEANDDTVHIGEVMASLPAPSRVLGGKVKPRNKPTTKQKRFAKVFAATLNATEAAVQAYPDLKNRHVAQSVGSENLAKPVVRQEIEKILNAHGVTLSEILSIHRRNLLQDKHLPTSQKAAEDFYDLLGMRGNTDKPSINVAFIIEN